MTNVSGNLSVFEQKFSNSGFFFLNKSAKNSDISIEDIERIRKDLKTNIYKEILTVFKLE